VQHPTVTILQLHFHDCVGDGDIRIDVEPELHGVAGPDGHDRGAIG